MYLAKLSKNPRTTSAAKVKNESNENIVFLEFGPRQAT